MRKCRAEMIFEVIMAKNIPKWMTDFKLQMQGALKTQSREKTKKNNNNSKAYTYIYSTVGSHSQREILNKASKNPHLLYRELQ